MVLSGSARRDLRLDRLDGDPERDKAYLH